MTLNAFVGDYSARRKYLCQNNRLHFLHMIPKIQKACKVVGGLEVYGDERTDLGENSEVLGDEKKDWRVIRCWFR